MAASISIKSKSLPAVICSQAKHLLHGSKLLSLRSKQFKDLAKILAKEVLPVPLGPVKR